MNKNKAQVTTPRETKVTISEKGLKVNKAVSLVEVTNMTLNGLMSAYAANTTDENREAMFAQLSLAFSNCLAYYAPDLYFPSEEELKQEEENMARLAQTYPDISDKIADAKAVVKTHMNEEDAFQPGEAIAFDSFGRALYPVEE